MQAGRQLSGADVAVVTENGSSHSRRRMAALSRVLPQKNHEAACQMQKRISVLCF